VRLDKKTKNLPARLYLKPHNNFIIQDLSILLPMDAFHRAGLHGFFNAIFRAAFGQNNFSYFFGFIKCKDFGTQFHTALTTNTFVGINDYLFSHFELSFQHVLIYMKSLSGPQWLNIILLKPKTRRDFRIVVKRKRYVGERLFTFKKDFSPAFILKQFILPTSAAGKSAGGGLKST
jgi:hypothetical protein